MVVLLAACDDYVDDDKAVLSSIDKSYIYMCIKRVMHIIFSGRHLVFTPTTETPLYPCLRFALLMPMEMTICGAIPSVIISRL